MDRLAIRRYVRFLITEHTDKPEAFIKNESQVEIDLNNIINIAQTKVELDLIPEVPHFFRKPALLSITVNKNVYDVVTDFNISDFLLFEDIFHNETGKRPQGLLYVSLDQVYEYTTVGKVDKPRVWTYESDTSIRFEPIPNLTVANAYKAYYFRKLPDLNQDTDHDPSEGKYAIPAMPAAAHILIAIKATIDIQIAKKSGVLDFMKLYEIQKAETLKLLNILPGLRSERRDSLAESTREGLGEGPGENGGGELP
jgi:hypothetical protein